MAGNSVRLLRDAADNYPAWLAAISGAQRYICFENFIYYEDEVGAEFSAALIERARAGVQVRLELRLARLPAQVVEALLAPADRGRRHGALFQLAAHRLSHQLAAA